jgi:hypothetical protein
MPINLLPASAQAFAPRAAPTIVLNTKVEQWLTQTLKRINKIKRPLNSVPQHNRCLTETLSGENAIWCLCSLMLPNKPDADLIKDSNPLVEGMFNYQLVHMEAYVVHVDMVSQHEVVFKLTTDSIDTLVDYHKDIYSVDAAASTWAWPEKDEQVKKLHSEFIQAINRFVFRTGVRALEGLEEDGAGELLDGRSDDVKNAIMGLFQPLLPPPPRIVDVVRQPQILPSSVNQVATSTWWGSTQNLVVPSVPAAIESWRVLPSTPSPTISACTTEPAQPAYWSNMTTTAMDVHQLPSPAPSFSQPAYCTEAAYLSPPLTTASIATSMASMPIPVPTMMGACGVSAANVGVSAGFGMGHGAYAGWGYGNESAFSPIYASAV